MLEEIFNDFILSAMLLQQCHISVASATMEFSNVLLSRLADCRPHDVTLTSM